MDVIVCLDDKNGMSFNGRRQSMDRVVRQHILQIANGRKLWMSSYSFGQFSQEDAEICVGDYPEEADVCFVEDATVLAQLKDIQKIIVFRWNRVYPADTYFPMQRFESNWQLIEKEDFAGYSHEMITREVYAL